MKTTAILGTTGVVLSLLLSSPPVEAQGRGHGRGMPAEARETIHGLFDAHHKLQREVKKTPEGYVSKTTSEDPAVVKLLQTHVKQMEKRLKSGLMVRRWDPAYEEFVQHYDDITIKITNIENGISIKATGSTEMAQKVARNHAGIISKFIKNGWAEHDKRHAVVAGSAPRDHKPACGDGNEQQEDAAKACAKCANGAKCADPKAKKNCCADGPAGKKACCPKGGASQQKPE